MKKLLVNGAFELYVLVLQTVVLEEITLLRLPTHFWNEGFGGLFRGIRNSAVW